MQVQFQLIRYFNFTSLVAFVGVASTMVYFQTREFAKMESVQKETVQTFKHLHAALAEQAGLATPQDALTSEEEGNVKRAQLLSTVLWDDPLAPFLAATRKIDFSPCRDSSQTERSLGGALASPAAKACLSQRVAQVQTLAAHGALDGRLQRAAHGSSITKIRLHDLQGVTLYSTDRTQVGEDNSGVAGWQRAARGLPSSELLPQAPLNPALSAGPLDVITSHVPVTDPRTNQAVAILEVQSGITSHLQRARHTSAEVRATAADHHARMEAQWQEQRSQARRSQQLQLVTLAGLLALLYAALHAIVQRAQGTIERQARESDAHKQRLAQSEKMTSLGNMVASVAHQLNTPLAFSKSNVSMAIQALDDMAPSIRSATRALDQVVNGAANSAANIVGEAAASRALDLDTDSVRAQLSLCPGELSMTQDMLGDVLKGLNQMNEMVDNLRSFTRLDRSRTADVDLNTTLSSVIYIARAVVSTKVQVVQKFSPLPRLACQVSQLNQVFLNLIMNAAQAIEGAGLVTVSTATLGQHIRVTIEDNSSGIPDDVLPRIFEPNSTTDSTTAPQSPGTGMSLAIARDIVAEQGGTLQVTSRVGIGTTFQIEFPIPTGPTA